MAENRQIEPDDLGLRDIRGQELETLRIDDWERKLIRESLKRTGGSVPEAAKLLGIGRATLYRKLDDYGISR
jgi:Nif-specific regulatory protein